MGVGLDSHERWHMCCYWLLGDVGGLCCVGGAVWVPRGKHKGQPFCVSVLGQRLGVPG